MTRKQAIRILVYKVFPCLKNSEWGEALKMAIKALEQEQYYKDLAESYEKTINKLTKAIAEQEPKTNILDQINGEIKEYCEKNCMDGDIVADELSLIIDKYREQEPKQGHWNYIDAYPHSYWVCCDKCKTRFIPNKEWIKAYNIPTNYCPNCGARMESEDDNT